MAKFWQPAPSRAVVIADCRRQKKDFLSKDYGSTDTDYAGACSR